jgi:hypothetical protein
MEISGKDPTWIYKSIMFYINALPSPLLSPLEGLSVLNCEKLGLEGRSRLSALKGGRRAC